MWGSLRMYGGPRHSMNSSLRDGGGAACNLCQCVSVEWRVSGGCGVCLEQTRATSELRRHRGESV